jgi:hypothetical protein
MASILTSWVKPIIEEQLPLHWQHLSKKASDSAATEVAYPDWLPSSASSVPAYHVQPKLDRQNRLVSLAIKFSKEQPEAVQVREVSSPFISF